MVSFYKKGRFWQLTFSLLSIAFFVGALAGSNTYGLRFTASGDFGDDSNAAATIRSINELGSEFHLALGDLSYGDSSDPNLEQNWCNFVSASLASGGGSGSATPFQLLVGNHEDDLDRNGYIGNYASCLPDKMSSTGTYSAHYYFDQDNARFIMVSPSLSVDGYSYTYTAGSTEYNELASWIDDARTAGIQWIIVGMHRNCITTATKPSCEVGTDVMDLLINKSVDLILQGHDHTYQRSYQLQHNATCSSLAIDSFNPDCINPTRPSNTYSKGDGPVVIIVATGGHGLYDLSHSDPESSYFERAMGKNAGFSYGNLVVDIDDDTSLHGEYTSTLGSYSDKFVVSNDSSVAIDASDSAPSSLVGDFNGDGKDDLAAVHRRGDITQWNVTLSNGRAFGASTVWKRDFGNANDEIFVGDFNGDGKDDIAYMRPVSSTTHLWKYCLSDGISFRPSKIFSDDFGNDGDNYYVGDFNGDDKDDIGYYRQPDASTTLWKVGLSQGSSLKWAGTWISDMGNVGDTFYIADLNGDGKDDIAYSRVNSPTTVQWKAGLSSGSKIVYKGTWSDSVGDSDDTFIFADINGDSKDDILYVRHDNYYTNQIRTAYSSGRYFESSRRLTSDYGNDGDGYRVGDFNGNGEDDITTARVKGPSTLQWKVGYLHPYSDRGVWKGDFGGWETEY